MRPSTSRWHVQRAAARTACESAPRTRPRPRRLPTRPSAGPVCDAPCVEWPPLPPGSPSFCARRDRRRRARRARPPATQRTDRRVVRGDIERRVRGLLDRVAALESRAEQDARDLDHLVELVGVGIVHLTDELEVDAANAAAHVFLRRAPGTMRDRPALEAFVDAPDRGDRPRRRSEAGPRPAR